MNRIFVISLALILSGCGSSSNEDESCNTQHSTASVMVAESGLLLEPSEGMYLTFWDIATSYLEVQACMDVTTTGPTVMYENFIGPIGVISLGTGIIRINTNPALIRNCEQEKHTLKHEFVHYLLHASGESIEDNVAHLSPFLGLCV